MMGKENWRGLGYPTKIYITSTTYLHQKEVLIEHFLCFSADFAQLIRSK